MNSDANATMASMGYQRLEVIGKGAYGEVYKAKHLATGELVAMKKEWPSSSDSDEGVPFTAIREISILKELDHPNVVRLIDVFMRRTDWWLAFELVSTDLKKYMERSQGGLEIHQIKHFMGQMCSAMDYCHSRRILHRDLKPANILVTSEGDLKIADFGLARAISVPMRGYTHEVVTLWYRAPEILLGGKQYAMPIDIWSMGCIFAEMVKGKAVFMGDSEIGQLFAIFQEMGTPNRETWPDVESYPDYRPIFPQWRQKLSIAPQAGEHADNLLQLMLKYSPASRISAREALKHPFFN
jgi:serine/threonine protein kinase